ALGFEKFVISGGFKEVTPIVNLQKLQVVLLQKQGKMQLEFSIGEQGSAQNDYVALCSQQIRALLMLSNALGEESRRIQARLAPPDAKQWVNLNTKEGIQAADRELLGAKGRSQEK
ncbi:unnamed protein product, partial [Effrenium voratum]